MLIAAGRADEARARLQTALDLADETSMHFYDAELTEASRATPPTTSSHDTPTYVAAIELARGQDARIFELRAAADDFELCGEPAREALTDALSRFPGDSSLAGSRRAPGRCSGEAPRRQGRHPRWRYGRAECGLAAQRARLA